MDPGMVVNNTASFHKGTEMVRAVIRLLVWVVSLGYLMMWIMMPTNKYSEKWLPNIAKKVNSTYFGTQGVSLLVYTFPVLFVAVVGCIYLHLGKRTLDTNRTKRITRLGDTLKRPMLVNGPLGIVSRIELAFLVMFVGLLAWSLGVYLHTHFDSLTPELAAVYRAKKMWEAKLGLAAWLIGLVGNICLTLLFFPVARGSSVLRLFGLTSEACIKYHTWLGHLVVVFFSAHGICFIIYWAVTDQISEMVKWDKTGIANVAGEMTLLFGLVLWVTTFRPIRRKMFELFFYTHHLYILFIIFFIFHVGISFACIMLPGFYLFLIDRFLRFLQSRQRVRLVSARILPCEALELNFSKSPGLRYTPTSNLFISVPSISMLQWHPFTVVSSSSLEHDKLSVVIKGEGSWTKKLYQMVSSTSSSIDRLKVAVEGPYGPVSTHFLRHDTLVLVSGGSGITPLISIIRELIFTSTIQNCKIPPVLMICAFKNSSDLAMLDLILPISCNPSTFSSLQLTIEAYVTREKKPTDDNSKLIIRTKWFRPHEKDAPIYPLLGSNRWLYLGMIISSSFVIFLIIIGIITRYYIYPRDHNTEREFSYTLRAFLNMLVLCACITITASAAVMWNKKINAREASQIMNSESSATPGSLDTDRELESLPHESVVQATNVHYGQRPDLKRILLDCRGPSVGVLACGPKGLRHDVARICGSGLADNLHFESISFCW